MKVQFCKVKKLTFVENIRKRATYRVAQKMYTLFTHQYLWNKFKLNFYFRVRVYYNVFSTDGTGALISFAQQMAQALLAGADVLKCLCHLLRKHYITLSP